MPKMRAVQIREWGGRLFPAEVDRPTPRAGEVLIKMEACNVGLSVVNFLTGMLGAKPENLPRIPGHEIAGVVAEVGPAVTTAKPGDRVISYGYLSCGYCKFCRRSKEPLCLNLKGLPGVDIDGGYAEYCVLPAINVVPLPDSISFLDGSTIPDAITTSYHVVSSRGNVRPGDNVMVIGGAGGVGIHTVQMAKVFGGDVIAVDIDDAKLAKTKEHGASWTVNFRSPDAKEAVLAATDGEGADVVVDFVGRPETLEWGLGLLGRSGRMVLLTTFAGVGATFSPRDFVRNEMVLMGSRYAAKFEELAAIELVRTGKIKPVISEVVPLERVQELHDKLVRAEFFARGAITFS